MIPVVSGADPQQPSGAIGRTVHMVIKTSALSYDDRLRKEVQSLSRLGCRVSATILEDMNVGRTQHSYDDGVSYPFRVFCLLSRRVAPWRAFLLLHLLEFVLRTCVQILSRRPQVVWIHDPVLLVFMPILCLFRALGIIERIIWDQHELPIKPIDASKRGRFLFGLFCRGADRLVVANQQRLDYLAERYPGVSGVKGAVIRNFSDATFVTQPAKPLPDGLQQWLQGREYFLVQSGTVAVRQFRTVADAIIPNPNLPVIVAVGGGNAALIEECRQRYGELFEQRVYLLAKVPQMELTRYLDGAVASLIFYQRECGINNWLCEPNRLFQALSRGVPVIAGNNPPIGDILTQYPMGELTADDGTSPVLLAQAVQRLLDRRSQLPSLSPEQRLQIAWASQEDVIRDLVT